MGSSRWVHLDVQKILRQTKKAFLFRLSDRDEVWVPQSVISDVDRYDVGDTELTISVAAWWAEANDLD